MVISFLIYKMIVSFLLFMAIPLIIVLSLDNRQRWQPWRTKHSFFSLLLLSALCGLLYLASKILVPVLVIVFRIITPFALFWLEDPERKILLYFWPTYGYEIDYGDSFALIRSGISLIIGFLIGFAFLLIARLIALAGKQK